MLTDVQWSAYGAPPETLAFLNLEVEMGGYQVGLYRRHARADGSGSVGDTASLPKLLLRPGERLCVQVGLATLEFVTISGFLTRDG